jgi:mono/diheme cytochrome c family protein
MKTVILACVVITVFACAFAAYAQKEDESSALTYGRSLYFRNCSPCHGLLGNGRGPNAWTMPVPPANFTDPRFWEGNFREMIQNTVENGYRAMPPIPLYPAQISAITNYMFQKFGPGSKG